MNDVTTHRANPGQRVAYTVALILILSGAVHVVVWLVDKGPWEGSVSWRKPILFGFSAGVTVFSIGWLTGKIRSLKGDNLLTILFALAMLIEVGLITMQVWRGVPSHFNSSSPFDALVLNWIEGLILFATGVIGYLTLRSFGNLRASCDMRLAIRSGMLLLLFACLFGLFMVNYGNSRVAKGQSPEVFGARGVMKFPHGMPIHAIQYLPLIAWSLNRLGAGDRERFRSVTFALASIVAFTAYSLIQTFAGRARFELNAASATVLFGSAFLLAIPALGILNAIRHRLKSDVATAIL